MTIKTKPAAATEVAPAEDGANAHINTNSDTCGCGNHADIVEGRCRRCALPAT